MFKPSFEIKTGDLITHRYMNTTNDVHPWSLCSNSVYTVIAVDIRQPPAGTQHMTINLQLAETRGVLLFWEDEAVEVVS